jgi:hypothetical protein
MKKLLFGAGLTVLFLFMTQGGASAQTMTLNGDFEFQALDPWEMFGNNDSQQLVQYDIDGDGTSSLCWKKIPGTNGGNGGIRETIFLIGGLEYEVSAKVATYVFC